MCVCWCGGVCVGYILCVYEYDVVCVCMSVCADVGVHCGVYCVCVYKYDVVCVCVCVYAVFVCPVLSYRILSFHRRQSGKTATL